jgi:hypothetical protein
MEARGFVLDEEAFAHQSVVFRGYSQVDSLSGPRQRRIEEE